MTAPAAPDMRLAHFGMFVRDIERMTRFYKDVLGFIETDRGRARGFDVVFLTRDPGQHHQLVLSSGRSDESTATDGVQQLSFKVASLDDLRAMSRIVDGRDDVSDIQPVDHGNAWSFYFRDPEENRIELYLDTPWQCAQPHREALDLSLDDGEILRVTDERLRNDPSRKPAGDWAREIAARLATGAG
jgi:catechol-2,3-dioxygenase